MTVGTYIWEAQSLDAIALLQAAPPIQGVGGVPAPIQGPFPVSYEAPPLQLILNGSIGNGSMQGVARRITLTSGDDLSGIEFTVNGSCLGFPVMETLDGPDAETVSTTAVFEEVYSITLSESLGTNSVSAGTGGSGFLSFFPVNLWDTWPVITVNVVVGDDAEDIEWSLCGVFEKTASPGSNDTVVVYHGPTADDMTLSLVAGSTSPSFPVPYLFLAISDTTPLATPDADNIIKVTYVATNT